MTARWVETELLAEEWFRAHGWPFAHRAGRGRRGRDLDGLPGLVPEVKSATAPKAAWLRQHDGETGVPLVVWRPPRMGPVSVGLWPVWFRLEDATRLLRAAGYGSEEE